MQIGKGSSANSPDAAKPEVRDAVPARPPDHELSADSGPSGSKDVISFGEGGDLLQRAFQLSAVNREGRVEEIRSKLADGSYSVNAEQVSQAIIRDMLAGAFPGTSGG